MKGLAPIITVLIMIILTVAIGGAVGVFYFNSISDTTEAGDETAKFALDARGKKIEILSVNGNNIIIKNIGHRDIVPGDIKILVNGEEVSITNSPTIKGNRTGTFIVSEDFSTSSNIQVIGPSNTAFFKIKTSTVVPDVEEECGALGNPCEIRTPEQLNNIRNDLDIHYILMSDIDLSGFNDDGNPQNGNWIPVGTSPSTFLGFFDGNGYIISNMSIMSNGEDNVGMFSINLGIIQNVSLTITSGIQGRNNIGGLVGINYGSVLYSDVKSNMPSNTISGGTSVGGLVGSNGGVIKNSYTTVKVTNTNNVGGLVGHNSGTIENSYATGNVSGTSNVGGLVGFNSDGECTNSYWDRQTSGISTTGCGAGNTTSDLQSPTSATGIYSTWSSSIWDFGTDSQYPQIKQISIFSGQPDSDEIDKLRGNLRYLWKQNGEDTNERESMKVIMCVGLENTVDVATKGDRKLLKNGLENILYIASTYSVEEQDGSLVVDTEIQRQFFIGPTFGAPVHGYEGSFNSKTDSITFMIKRTSSDRFVTIKSTMTLFYNNGEKYEIEDSITATIYANFVSNNSPDAAEATYNTGIPAGMKLPETERSLQGNRCFNTDGSEYRQTATV